LQRHREESMPSQRVLIYAVGAIIVVALLLYFGQN
jgi:hypothetical protein